MTVSPATESTTSAPAVNPAATSGPAALIPALTPADPSRTSDQVAARGPAAPADPTRTTGPIIATGPAGTPDREKPEERAAPPRRFLMCRPEHFAVTYAINPWMAPDAVVADEADAAVPGLNAVCDGRHVVINAEATGLIAALRRRGHEPVPVDLSELRKAGGGPKCCTLEIRM